jgi:hypothetical protein
VALKVKKHRLMSVLRSNIDLGAIFYSENYGKSAEENAEIAFRINSVRPELPIFLRKKSASDQSDALPSASRVFCATYTSDDLSDLKKAVDDYIFSLYYPCDLVRGITEITENAFSGQFKHMSIRGDTPFIVRDRVIFGEVFSLIPLESAWCRGYMMIQTEEAPMLDVINKKSSTQKSGFRDVNNLLAEVTNLIWGAFKNRYIGDASVSSQLIQVPLIVNHKHKYISFGTENPQLCFFYLLTDDLTGESVKVYQRFIFNLSWSPEDFKEIIHDSTALVEAGELELF